MLVKMFGKDRGRSTVREGLVARRVRLMLRSAFGMRVRLASLAAALVCCAVLFGCSSSASSFVVGGDLSHEEYAVEALPAWFEEELFSVDDAMELYASEGGRLVGVTLPKSATESFFLISASMQEGEWVVVESGMEGVASFMRDGAVPGWALVSCVDVGGATSVVVQLEEVPR